MIERMRARPRGYARRTIMIIDASPLMKMAITVADVTFALFGGKRTEVFHEIHRATRELGAIVPGGAPGWVQRTAG